MYDIPVVVETKPEKEVVVAPTVDTIVSIPVIVEAIPEPIKIAVPIDTIVTEPVLAKTQPAETKTEVDLVALAKQSTTYYPFNVDTLSQSNKENLKALIEYLNQNPKAKIVIFGNADRLGSESYNLTLSAARAKKVKDYLVSEGIQASRIKTVAYGEVKAKGETEEERALNRCAEFSIIAR
jgi:outer membrane protein OmpA-like peptidoglycan-associated protein